MNNEIEKKKWFDKKLIVILLILFIPPIGLYALFKGSHGNFFRIIFTVIGVLFTISFFGSIFGDSKTEKQVSASDIESNVNIQENDSDQFNVNIQENDSDQLKDLKKASISLRGSGQINRIDLIEGKAVITYVSSFSSYKRNQPQSKLTSKDISDYWTEKTIEKSLVDGPSRLMKKLNFIDEVEIIMPLHKRSITVKKTDLEKFVGFSMEQIREDWNNKFSHVYIYDDKGRRSFVEEFSK